MSEHKTRGLDGVVARLVRKDERETRLYQGAELTRLSNHVVRGEPIPGSLVVMQREE